MLAGDRLAKTKARSLLAFMTVIRTVLSTTILLALVLIGRTGVAQAPSGSITNQIVGATNAIWDISLFEGLQNPSVSLPMIGKVATNYWKSLQADSSASVPGSNYLLQTTFTSPFVQNGRGQFVGHGTNTMSLSYQILTDTGNIFDPWASTNVLELTNVAGNYVVSGSIHGISGVAVLRYISRASGALPVSGKRLRVSTIDALYVVIQAATRVARESYGNIISVTGQRRLQLSGPDSESLPDYLGDGTWSLVLNFESASATTSTRLSGWATVTLNSGTVFPFTFSGRYSAKTGRSTLLLKGVNNEAGNAKGATLTVTLAGDQVVSLLGRIAGQVIRQK